MTRTALLWLLSLIVVAGLATIVTAQVVQPRILSGADVGFRVERVGPAGEPMGTLMIRVNGKWVEAGWATKPQFAK